jgi:hypothetical protein
MLKDLIQKAILVKKLRQIAESDGISLKGSYDVYAKVNEKGEIKYRIVLDGTADEAQ